MKRMKERVVEAIRNFGEFQEKMDPEKTPHYQINIVASPFFIPEKGRSGCAHAFVSGITEDGHLLYLHIQGLRYVEDATQTIEVEREGFWSFLGPKKVKRPYNLRSEKEVIEHLEEFILEQLPEATPGKWFVAREEC